MFKRTRKKREYAYPIVDKEKKGILKVTFDKLKKKSSSNVPLKINTIKDAEHSIVLQGVKQNSSVICVKIKDEMNEETEAKLSQIRKIAEDSKAVYYKAGDYLFFIFSPMVTKTYKNHTQAVKTALAISNALSGKADYGISVHAGEIINKFEGGKLKFTSLGNTLGLVKRIAELSKGEVLLSQEIHQKTLSDIKTEKQEISGLPVFKIRKFNDSSTQYNKKFIHEFLNKLEKSH